MRHSKSLFFVLGMLASVASQGYTVYGLTTRDQLVKFDSSSPMMLSQQTFIQGLGSNESLLGIDYRPANGMIYGVGSFGKIYTINPSTGMATFVANLFNSTTSAPIMLNGSEFGVDFNPVADRLRLTSDAGMNLRINVASGATIVDGALNQSSGMPYIVGSAYTNSDNDATTGTTLYNIDSSSNMLTVQNPPNNGTQVGVGPLGVDITALAGFDIVRNGANNFAFAALQPSGTVGSMFASVNLTTGAAMMLGNIGMASTSDSIAIRDITIMPVPEPATMAALALSGLLIRRRRSV